MGRLKTASFLVAFLFFPLIVMLMQIDVTSAQPPIGQTSVPPFGSVGTVTGGTIAPPEVTPSPTPVPIDPNLIFAREVRLDLERLADQALNFTRPNGWIGTNNVDNPSLIIDTRFDLELLAGTLLGANTRPNGWFGTIPSTTKALARDLRHDVELLADTIGTGRPDGWTGGDPMMRCDRLTQAVVEFLELNGVFNFTIDPSAPDYCQQAEIQASTFMEINILANPQAGQSLVVQGLSIVGGNATVNSDFAAAFLDRFANQRVGVVPNGTSIETVGRSPTEFSNMMLIRGQSFEVYVDYQFTSVSSQEFDNLLPIDEASISPYCDASWCN